MTCRIRAGEVARPRCRGFTPRAARIERTSAPATRLARVLHSCRSTSVDPSSERRQDSASARTAPPLWRGLVVGRDLDARMSEKPNRIGDLWRYSPLTRSGGQSRFRPGAETGGDPRTSSGMQNSARWVRALRDSHGPLKGPLTTVIGGTPFGSFQTLSKSLVGCLRLGPSAAAMSSRSRPAVRVR